jgi:DNA-binding NarL/FixJ family response regulator
VLLDISMPGLSGISALPQLRARDPKLGVIMVTGDGDENIARRTLALGAFDYVTKPVDFDYLRRSIETLLLMRSLISPDLTGAAAPTL